MATRRDPRTFDESGDVVGGYLTPDEAGEQGVEWMGRPGEPDDLDDPYHYQTPDDAVRLGRDWATQAAGIGGRDPRGAPESQGGMPAVPGGGSRWDIGNEDVAGRRREAGGSPIDLQRLIEELLRQG